MTATAGIGPSPQAQHVDNPRGNLSQHLHPRRGIREVLREVRGESHPIAVEVLAEFLERRPVDVPDESRRFVDDRATGPQYPDESVKILSPESESQRLGPRRSPPCPR